MDMEDFVIIRKQFQWPDYVVFVIFLVLLAVIGIIIGIINRHKATSKEFLQAGSEMHFVPVAFSMQASFISAITLVSLPSETYNFGITYSYVCISYFVAYPLIGKFFLPVFFNLKITSAYEYLQIRFNSMVRLAGSITFMIQMILYLAVVIYSPALTIQQVTDLPTYACILIVSGICIIYTVVGGMRATIWNDLIQVTVIFIMLAMVIGFGYQKAGSFKEVYDIAKNGSRMEFKIFDPDPRVRTTFWTQVVGGCSLNFATYAASQTFIQKALSTKSLKDAQRSLTVLSITNTVLVILLMWIGTIMYAYYHECDPIMAGFVDKPDQILPNFVMDIMGHMPGLPGLFMASIFSGALSSVSGCLNAMAGVTLVDFVGPVYEKRTGENIPDRLGSILSRLFALFFGLVVMALAFAAPLMGDLILQIALSIFGMVGGPLCGVVAAGIFMPCCNSWGALAGLIVSLGVTLWLGIGTMVAGPPLPILPHTVEGCLSGNSSYNSSTPMYDLTTAMEWTTSMPEEDDVFGFYKLSYMYYGLVAIGVAMLVAFLVSAMTGFKKDVPHNQIYSCADECCCCYPLRVKECCRCGSLPAEEDEESQPQVLKVHFSKSSGDKVPGFDLPIRQTSFTIALDEVGLSLSPSAEKPGRIRRRSFHTDLFHLNDPPENQDDDSTASHNNSISQPASETLERPDNENMSSSPRSYTSSDMSNNDSGILANEKLSSSSDESDNDTNHAYDNSAYESTTF